MNPPAEAARAGAALPRHLGGLRLGESEVDVEDGLEPAAQAQPVDPGEGHLHQVFEPARTATSPPARRRNPMTKVPRTVAEVERAVRPPVEGRWLAGQGLRDHLGLEVGADACLGGRAGCWRHRSRTRRRRRLDPERVPVGDRRSRSGRGRSPARSRCRPPANGGYDHRVGRSGSRRPRSRRSSASSGSMRSTSKNVIDFDAALLQDRPTISFIGSAGIGARVGGEEDEPGPVPQATLSRSNCSVRRIASSGEGGHLMIGDACPSAMVPPRKASRLAHSLRA